MRNRPNETAPNNLTPGKARGQRAEPERRCILTGESRPASDLLRLAISPEGEVLPDIHAKAPGRGAWVSPSRALIERAGVKGLKGALARGFKGASFQIPEQIADRIAQGLAQATLDRLGLEARASNLLSGSEKIAAAARGGQVSLLLHSNDSGEDGRAKLDQAWRVGSDREGSGLSGRVLPVGRDILSRALGRQNAVHAALTDQAAADRVNWHLDRWLNYEISPMEPQAAAE